jgi:hypothetical protein
MGECSFAKFAPLEWYLIFALLACFALGVIQLRKLQAALFTRPRQTIPRAITYGVFGVLLCALPLADAILFAAGQPSALVSLASARAGWCDLTKLNAEKSEQIGQLTKKIAELESKLAMQAQPTAAVGETPTFAAPAPAPEPVAGSQPLVTPPQPKPKPAVPPTITALIDTIDATATAETPPARREDFKVVVYYRRSNFDLAGNLSSRMGERFETVAEPSDLRVKTVKPPGTIRIVYTENSAFALPDVRKVVSDALQGDESREVVADKVNDLRNGDLQIQLF